MLFTPNVIINSIKEAVSLAELKAHCQIDSTAHDTVLEIYRVAARRYVEEQAARTIHEKTLEWVIDEWPSGNFIKLPRATPLIAAGATIKYKDSAGSETTWSSAEYIADVDQEPGRIVLAYGYSWPSGTLYPSSPIRIRAKAGLVTASPASECAAEIKLPVLMIAKGMFENRDSLLVTDTAVAEIAQRYGAIGFIQQLIVH